MDKQTVLQSKLQKMKLRCEGNITFWTGRDVAMIAFDKGQLEIIRSIEDLLVEDELVQPVIECDT